VHLEVTTAEDIGALELAARDVPLAALSTARRWFQRREPALGEIDVRRLELVVADARARLGEVREGARTAREISAWSGERSATHLEARSHRVLASVFATLGDTALALEHAVRGVDLLPPSASSALRADHVLVLATVLGVSGLHDESRRRFEEVVDLAQAGGVDGLRRYVLNNMAFLEVQAGNPGAALHLAGRLEAMAAQQGERLALHELDTVAFAHLANGAVERALALLGPVLSGEYSIDGAEPESVVTCLLTLVRVQRERGALDAAQRALDECRHICERTGLDGRKLEALRAQADLYAAAGRFQDAYEAFARFYDESRAHDSADRDMRSRTLHAIFEVREAQQASQHFRELSERDPLTGLYNRRYVDSELAALCTRAVDLRHPFVVALLDLDHFKRVNDLRSHQIGDRVLARVARLLTTAAADVPGGWVARMGGEEFLLVLPDTEEAPASRLLDRVRREIEAHPWDDLTAGVPVTASIGWASAPLDGAERALLLSRADMSLYAAKRAGRNRLMPGVLRADRSPVGSAASVTV